MLQQNEFLRLREISRLGSVEVHSTPHCPVSSSPAIELLPLMSIPPTVRNSVGNQSVSCMGASYQEADQLFVALSAPDVHWTLHCPKEQASSRRSAHRRAAMERSIITSLAALFAAAAQHLQDRYPVKQLLTIGAQDIRRGLLTGRQSSVCSPAPLIRIECSHRERHPPMGGSEPEAGSRKCSYLLGLRKYHRTGVTFHLLKPEESRQ